MSEFFHCTSSLISRIFSAVSANISRSLIFPTIPLQLCLLNRICHVRKRLHIVIIFQIRKVHQPVQSFFADGLRHIMPQCNRLALSDSGYLFFPTAAEQTQRQNNTQRSRQCISAIKISFYFHTLSPHPAAKAITQSHAVSISR